MHVAWRTLSQVALAIAIVLLAAGLGVDLYAQRELSPSASSHNAAVGLLLLLEGFYVAAAIAMALFALARASAGLIDRARSAVLDNTMLFWHYTVAQSLIGLALVHGFPRLVK
jgi:hypothetical protein